MVYFHKGDFLDEKDELIVPSGSDTEFYWHMLSTVNETISELNSYPKLEDMDREFKDVEIALHHLKRKLEEKRIGDTQYKIGEVRHQG